MAYPFVIEIVESRTDSRKFKVIRDDLVPGGTKQRVLVLMLKPNVEYVYPSPAYGYAQIALALACREVGARATVLVAARNTLHERTQRAADAGAQIIEVPFGMQSVVNARARLYASHTNAVLMPLGFDCQEFDDCLDEVLRPLKIRPKQVFCAVGTGTLYRGLVRKWTKAEFYAVQAGMRPHIHIPHHLVVAPERYEQDAKQPPPFPSCSNVDAKAWRFVEMYGSDGALLWNVAG